MAVLDNWDMTTHAIVSSMNIAALDCEIRRLQRAKRRLQKVKASPVVMAPLDNVTVQRDTWARSEVEVRGLIDAYWAEVRADSQPDHLALDSSMYEILEENGTLVVVTVRDGGKLVGFSGWTIIAHHHYAHVLTGVDDSWYLADDYRQGSLGLRLFQRAQVELKAEGCEHVIASTSVAKNVEALLLREKFEPFEILYSKKL